ERGIGGKLRLALVEALSPAPRGTLGLGDLDAASFECRLAGRHELFRVRQFRFPGGQLLLSGAEPFVGTRLELALLLGEGTLAVNEPLLVGRGGMVQLLKLPVGVPDSVPASLELLGALCQRCLLGGALGSQLLITL